jgi:hypothetical protein
MLKSYKMHEAQLAGIAQSMKELYHMRRPESSPSTTTRFQASMPSRKDCPANAAPGAGSRIPRMADSGEDRISRQGYQNRPASRNTSAEFTLPVIRCSRCGDDFPVTDFLYTKKTGLCIACWEATIRVAKSCQ